MKLWQKSLMSLGLVLGLVLLTGAQADEKDTKKGDKKGRPGSQLGQQRDLVSTEVQEKLKLTTEQKEKIAKLNTEFTDKVKPIAEKLKEARGQGFEKVRESIEELRKVRTEFSDKVKALLNDEQKKTFDEESRSRRFGQGGNFGRPGQGRTDSSIFSRDVQEKLGLSAEQKEKLEKIKKELDEKSLDVLTGDQKKKLEDLKKDQPRPNTRTRPQTEKKKDV